MSTNNVPNPFWLGDQLVLDWIFNPISWWSNYHYGNDAMDLRLGFAVLGYLLLVFSAVYNRSFIFLFLLLVAMSLLWLLRDVPRREWVQNNKTGKNIKRVEYFWIRMVDLALLTFIIISTSSHSWFDMIFWVNMLAFIFIIILCAYLDATDTLPPNYHERKTAFQFS